MAVNMMNSSHKATNVNYRDNYEETFGKKKAKPPVGHRLHLWFSPSQKHQSSKMRIPSELALTFGQLDTGEIVEYTSANRVFDNTSRYDDIVYLGTGTYHHSASKNISIARQPATKVCALSVTCPTCGYVLLLPHEGIHESKTFYCHVCGVRFNDMKYYFPKKS